MGILLGTVFVASLLGSLHCVGMCGPFALVASSSASSRRAALAPTLAYSAGRLVTYTLAGILFGALGLAINTMAAGSAGSSTRWATWQQTATYLAGGLMILVGAIALARQLGFTIRLPRMAGPLQRVLQSAHQRVLRLAPLQRALWIGMLTTLMPCGWLYTFAITAAGTGSPLWGGLVMISFWAGTIPVMAALMLGFSRIAVRWQRHVPVAMAALVIALGLFTVVYRAPVALGDETRAVEGTDALIEQLHKVDHETLPCCQPGGRKDFDDSSH